MRFTREKEPLERKVEVPIGRVVLHGDLVLPRNATGLVVFAHGSGSSRHSPRNRFVARVIQDAGVGTLLFDLLTREEELAEMETGYLRFDIPFLAERLNEVAAWAERQAELRSVKIGYFGSSTGGGAALVAAAAAPERVGAVVSRGGRPDLAAESLPAVRAPTLLIVGGRDVQVLSLNKEALARLTCEKELRVVPGATHLFEEPGTLEEVARLAAAWFAGHLSAKRLSLIHI